MIFHFKKKLHLQKSGIFLLFLLMFAVNAYGQTTLYSYKSGLWNDLDTWTTDPGGTTLVGSKIPDNGDIIVILSSRIVSLPLDISTTNLDLTIRSGGVLDMSTFQFTNTLTALRGQGTIRLYSGTFPAATLNSFVQSGGGTTEYRNTSAFTLPASQNTFNNLNINVSDASFIVTQLHNITINGNLTIIKGNYQINNNNPARFQLTIHGNLTVNSGSSVSVGTGNTTTTTNPTGITGGTAPFVNYYDQNTHRIVLYGDFTNNGSVRFTNQTYPQYNVFPTDGAASVFFMGTSNNTLTCNNTTDFYNLIIDKGSDQTFALSVNSAGYGYFRLFGANISGGEGGGDNPILKRALWIRNGTMRLYGLVAIPSLSEGVCDAGLSGGPNSDFYIPANGALVIEGPDVVVLTTADSYLEVNAAYGTSAPNDAALGLSIGGCSSFSVLGKFQIDDGYISTRESGGFIYWGNASGQFIINGGTLDSKQFRTANSSGGLTAYRQTNGTLTLRGRFQRTVSGVTDVASLRTVPLNTTRAGNGINGNVGTFNVDQDANIFEMTGGTIEILDVCGVDGSTIGRAFEVNSLPSYVNVSGGSVIIRPTTGSGTDYPYYFVSAAPIGNLTISQSSGTQPVQLTNITKAGVTARDPSLNVLGSIILSGTNARLTANNYNVEAGGNFDLPTGTTYTPGNNRTIFDGKGSQTFTGNGTITSGFNTLRIDKPSGTLTMAGTPASYIIRDSLQIAGGTISDGGKTLYVSRHIYVAGTHTGAGRIVLNGTANQNITYEISGNPALGNVVLSNNAGATLINNGTMGSFTFSVDALMNLGSYKLTINTTPVAGYSQNRYFNTNGIASNGGLRLAVNAASLTTGNNLLFPVGTSGKYTPVTIVGNSAPGSGNGYVSITPVNSVHPSASGSGQKLDYYWRSQATGLPAGSNVYFHCVNTVNADWGGGINNAAVLISGNTDWLYGGAANRPDVILNDDSPMLQGFISADITAGNPGAFNNVAVYFSIASGAYNSNDVWSITSHTGVDCNCHPTNASDVIYIGGNALTSRNDSITVTANFNASSITISGSFTNDSRMPVFNIQNFGGGSTVDIIRGNGKFTTTSSIIPVADYGDFVNSTTAVFNYHGDTYTLPATLTTYPNLLITGISADRIKTLPNANILVKQNLLLSTNFTGNTLRYNATGGNLTVYGDIRMRNSSLLQLTGNNSRSLNVYGDIDMRYLNSDNTNTINVNSGTGTHQVKFYGDNIIMGRSTIDLTNSTFTMYDAGPVVVTDRTGGTGNITFNRFVLSKDNASDTVTINHPFTLSGATNGYPKALELITGALKLNNSNIGLTLSSGGANFSIPSTTSLTVMGGSSVSVTGTNTGISLDGLLRGLDNALIDLGNGTTSDNRYIEYSGSGNAMIMLAGSAALTVNAQIRRSLLQTNGVLKYRQSGNSTATICGSGASASRAKLEIDNSGSEFTMSGGSLTIVRGGGTTYGDLFLRAESANVTGGTIFLGTQNMGAQTIKMDATFPLFNVVMDGVGAANEFDLMVNPLVLNGSLSINTANSTFKTNSIDVSLKGNFTNNGIYLPGTNTTTFNGTTQTISGSTATDFYDLVLTPSVSVTAGNHMTINNDLNLATGLFSTSTYDINIKGDLTNNATHSGNIANGGLLLNGTLQQLISGNGIFGRIELNNTAGARLLNNINLQQDFLLTNGVFNINQYLLVLGINSNIIGSGFNINKMIMPDGVFSNVGIRKFFSAGEITTFTYPIGVSGKYTPADVIITDNPSGGSIRLNIINSPHPTVLDPNNVLQYYWELGSNGFSSFEGNLTLHYIQGDVKGLENEYVAARLIVPPGTDWSKAAAGALTDNVDESLNTISFDFPSGTTNLGGEYTAGNDLAIPAQVPVFTSNGDGNWDDVTKWTPQAPPGGPNGFIVIIRRGDEISTNGNRRFAYMTTLNGTLNIGTTYGHNLGSVSGTGKLYLETNLLPAGRFTSFFNCSGGTLEYGGNSDYPIIADRLDTLHNLFFTGTGNRELPDKDLVICDTLKIDGPALINASDRKVTLLGLFQRLTGSFNSGTGNTATVVFAGMQQQTLGGLNGDFTGVNALNNIQINNVSDLLLNSPLEIKGDLILTEGLIHSTLANKLSMINGNSTVIPDGGTANSFVSGPLSKRIFGGRDFIFPTGKNTRHGVTTLLGVSDGTWQAEYFNIAYSSLAVIAPLISVSTTEYWHVKGPAANTAYVRLRWDPQSDVTPLTTQSGISDIRVAQYNGTSWIEQGTSAAGDNYNGTARTTDKMNLDEHDYTLGSVSSLKPRASFVNTNDICAGNNLSVAFSKTAGSYTFTYTVNGAPTVVTTASNPYPLPANTPGRYRITAFTGGVVDTNSVLVNPVPTATLTSDDPDNTICEGESVTFTAGGGVQYSFRINGTTVQNGASSTYSSSLLENGDVVTVNVTNASGCSDMSASITMVVNSMPVPTLSGLQAVCEGESQVYTTDNAAGYSNYTWTVTGGSYTGETTNQISVTWDAIASVFEDQLITVNYTDNNGCTALNPTELDVRVYRVPQTGPAYYVPNDHNQ
jgi:hypothetical protein